MHTYRNANCILVQLKMVSTCFKKPIMCSTLSLRSFCVSYCWSDWQWPFLIISRTDHQAVPLSMPLFSRWSTMPCPWRHNLSQHFTSSAHHLWWLLCLPVCLLDPLSPGTQEAACQLLGLILTHHIDFHCFKNVPDTWKWLKQVVLWALSCG